MISSFLSFLLKVRNQLENASMYSSLEDVSSGHFVGKLLLASLVALSPLPFNLRILLMATSCATKANLESKCNMLLFLFNDRTGQTHERAPSAISPAN